MKWLYIVVFVLAVHQIQGNVVRRFIGSFFGDDDDDEEEVHAVADVTEECRNAAAWGQCRFYECLEERFPCRDHGFAQYVGLHFCHKRAQTNHRLNAMGRRWRNVTSICLMRELLDIYNRESTTCEELKRVGGDGIAHCNDRVDADGTNFCQFVGNNSDAYRDSFEVTDLGRLMSLENSRVFSQMLLQGVGCGAGRLMDRLSGARGYVTGLMARLFHD